MVTKVVTYLGATIMQIDMNHNNFKSDDANGLVFAPEILDGDVTAESYTTYTPLDTYNPLWNNVDIGWKRNTINSASPFKTTFGLYGVTSMGDVNLIGEEVRSTIGIDVIDEHVRFDLLRSACEPAMGLTSDIAGVNELDVKLPFTYKNYQNIQLKGLTAERGHVHYKAFTVTGSTDGDNLNFAVGPVDIVYDADMQTDFSDVRFWKWDSDASRFIPIPALLIKKTDSTTARYVLEMANLLDSTVYNCLVSYGTLDSGTNYWLNSPYTKRDNNYQGQLHFHTTNSDGTSSLATTETIYRNMGYDWIAPSDHNYINTVSPGVSGILHIPCVEYNNNSIDWPYSRVHMNLLGTRNHYPYNPKSTADLVTEAAAGNITYNGATYTHQQMRFRITNGTFGLSTGDSRIAGSNTQKNIDMGHTESCFIQLNHPNWLNNVMNIVEAGCGFDAMAVASAVNSNVGDDEIDTCLTSNYRFNIGIEDDTHTFGTGSRSTTLTANVRTGTETSSDTTGWTKLVGTETITSDTTEYHTGTRSIKCVTPGGAATEGHYVTSTALATYYYWAHVWVLAPYGATMQFQKYDAVNGTVTTDFTGTGDWQRVTVQFLAGNTTPTLGVYTDGAQAITYYCDDYEMYRKDMSEGQTAFHVYADELTENDIISNLKAGNYYVTQYDHELELVITHDGTAITATSNKTGTIEWRASNGNIVQSDAAATTGTYTPTINDIYVRCKITSDDSGGVAWTNPIWIEEVL